MDLSLSREVIQQGQRNEYFAIYILFSIARSLNLNLASNDVCLLKESCGILCLYGLINVYLYSNDVEYLSNDSSGSRSLSLTIMWKTLFIFFSRVLI